jgi:hypothetical protein
MWCVQSALIDGSKRRANLLTNDFASTKLGHLADQVIESALSVPERGTNFDDR